MKNKSRGFLDVDLYQGAFGAVSVKAIFSIYAREMNKNAKEMKEVTFKECVNTLRKLKKNGQ